MDFNPLSIYFIKKKTEYRDVRDVLRITTIDEGHSQSPSNINTVFHFPLGRVLYRSLSRSYPPSKVRQSLLN